MEIGSRLRRAFGHDPCYTVSIATMGTVRKRLEPKERRLQLLDVGLRVFARKGLRDTTLEEVAAEAGVTKPVVYHYFDSKQAFFDAIAEREMKIVTARVVSAATPPFSGYEIVEKVATAFFEYLEERPDGFAALTGHAPINWYGEDRVSEIRRELYTQIGKGMRAAFRGTKRKAPKDIDLFAHSAAGQFIFGGQYWLESRRGSSAVAAKRLARVVWGGLGDLYKHER